MVDTPTPGPIANLAESLKYAVLPFGGMGGWYGLKWIWEQWTTRGDKVARQQREDLDERDRVRSSLDARSMALMDRLEVTIQSQAREIADLRKWAQEEVARAETVADQAAQERDILYRVALDREENAHERRHSHIRTIQKLNSVLHLFKRMAEGKLSAEAIEEVLRIEDETEPPRVADLRAHIRVATLEHRGGIQGDKQPTG